MIGIIGLAVSALYFVSIIAITTLGDEADTTFTDVGEEINRPALEPAGVCRQSISHTPGDAHGMSQP